MRLAILGGTGRTGRHLVDAALAAGHTVRVLSRNPYDREGAVEVRGDALDPAQLRVLIRGVDAVVCVLGPAASSPPDVCSRATALLVEAMREQGVKRLVVQTGAMVGHPALGRYYRWMAARPQRRAALEERRLQEQVVRTSGLDWTLIRPPRLTGGRGTGAARVGARLPIRALSKLARVDLAQVLLRAATTSGWKCQAVTALQSFTSQRPGVVLRQWVLRMGAAELLGIAVAAAVAGMFLVLFGEPQTGLEAAGFLGCALGAAAIEGLLLGHLPGSMLASCFPRLSRAKFRRNTLRVTLGAWLIGMLPSAWLAAQPGPVATIEPSLWMIAGVCSLGGAIAGAALGFAQWLVLRKVVDRAARWIAATSFGWALALPLDVLAGTLPHASDPWSKTVAVAAAFGLTAGVVVAIPTGLLLIQLLRERVTTGVAVNAIERPPGRLIVAH